MYLLPSGTFFGETLWRDSVSGFTFAISSYRPGTRIPPHAHESSFFYLVLDGACDEICQGRERHNLPSTLVFHPPGITHSDYWMAGGQCLHVEIAPWRMAQLREYAPVLDEPGEFRGGPAPRLGARIHQEIQRDDHASRLALEGLTLELLAETARFPRLKAGRSDPSWIREARELLDSSYLEEVTLQGVAEAVHVHPAHLARMFRRRYDCSVGEYVRQRRCEWACVQLAGTETSLAQIALTAGFVDQSHFCKTFRKLMGVTPSEYRRSCSSDTRT
jgi:AraC family transcriptional regulator